MSPGVRSSVSTLAGIRQPPTTCAVSVLVYQIIVGIPVRELLSSTGAEGVLVALIVTDADDTAWYAVERCFTSKLLHQRQRL